MQNFSQIEPILKSPACPKVSSLVLGLELVTTPLKIKILKNEKKHPQGFTQGASVQNFSKIEPFLKSPACPKVFRLVLGLKLVTTPLKNQNFEKMKKTPPGIHPRSKCAKFQPNRTIFEVSSLPQSFEVTD